MKLEILYAVFELYAEYDGSPKIIEVFEKELDALDFAKKKKEATKNQWLESEAKRCLDKKMDQEKLSQEEIKDKMADYECTIDGVINNTFKVDTLDNAIKEIRNKIHDGYASMNPDY